MTTVLKSRGKKIRELFNVPGTQKEKIISALMDYPSLTCDELEDITSIIHQSLSAQLTKLHEMGKVVKTGYYAYTKHGKPANLWKLTKNARF